MQPDDPDFAKFSALFRMREDGALFNRVCRGGNAPAGASAGCRDGHGYLQTRVGPKIYKCHRIVWLLAYGAWPKGQIDHINGDRVDNRPENLRDVTQQMNLQHRVRLHRKNTSGYTGVVRSKNGKRWVAQAKNPRTKTGVYLGTFDDAPSAAEVSLAYRQQHYAGHLNH